MQEQKIIQGTPEWHEFRAQHLNASDAPAMMGESPYKTRDALLREKAVGVVAEVSSETQRRFDDGHRFEALARPLAEKIIGEELYPVVGSEGKFAASFDGMTMLGDVIFEHKTLNAALAAIDPDEELPLYYRIQMEHQFMVSGAEKCLFMASKWDAADQLIGESHRWHSPDLALRQRIVDGWAQFEKDLAGYVPPEAKPEAVGRAPDALPALRIELTGQVTTSNLAEFRAHAQAVLGGIKKDNFQTDEDFASADKTAKWCSDVESRLDAAKQHALAQTTSIDELFRTLDAIKEDTRQVRLGLEKTVKARKEAVKLERINKAKSDFAAHVAALQSEIADVRLTVLAPDFGGAIKGLKTLASIDNAIGVAMANAKIAADQRAADVRAKLAWFNENATEYRSLFSDLQQLIGWPFDGFKQAVTARIVLRKQAEEAKLEAERERIRNEEAAKLAAQAESIKPPTLAAADLAASL
ncbi:lambda-exonuclease family protein, partial [Rivihabitans pingtungensis]|uniref:lambda-exonuclease family protein n=1 Tax=Rivihabitans pingtungensis TaxID=1054498 RepID=UPI002CB63497